MSDAARDDGGFTERVQGRLERLGLTPEDAGRAAGLPLDLIGKLLAGAAPPPRGQRLVKLADALATLTSLARVSVEVHVDPARVRPVDLPLLVADPSKLRAATGWEPLISIEQTLGDMLQDWRDTLAREDHAA